WYQETPSGQRSPGITESPKFSFFPFVFFADFCSFPSAAEPEVPLKPRSTKGTPSSSGRKRRAAFSPGPGPPSLRASPAAASPQRRRRSWRRSSLKGRRSRRRSLPPVHREVSELSKSISLELPEVQRLSLLLLSSFQVNSPQILNFTQNPEFHPKSCNFPPKKFLGIFSLTPQTHKKMKFRLQIFILTPRKSG
ncbi:kinetochore-associated protein DSN1 homolog, partial [Passerculus sandwichensis]